MRISHKIYVDESGDEGFRFDSGSSRWFVLSAVVSRAEDEPSHVALVNDVRDQINAVRTTNKIPPKKPLHFRDMKHPERKLLASRIAESNLVTVSVLIDKTRIVEPEKFEQGTRLYFYGVRLLLERLSWYCREDGRESGQMEVTFSNRSTIEYATLRNYVQMLLENAKQYHFTGDVSMLNHELIKTETAGRRLGLQIADAVAYAHFAAVEPARYGLTEDAYLRIIGPKAYRYRGKVFGYGVKIFPREADESIRRAGILPLSQYAGPGP